MKAAFNDMQDHSSSLDGAAVHDRQELFAVLDNARDREPFGCELEGENGYKLTLGVGKDVGFVQHGRADGRADGDTPYMVAVAPENYWHQEYAKFLVADTPTPIPQRFCLPFEMVKQIAAYFIETGERSPAFSWEEI
jgi:hypothetical protein